MGRTGYTDTDLIIPVPTTSVKCYKQLGYKKGDYPITELYGMKVLSPPIYTGMTWEEQDYVIDKLKSNFNDRLLREGR